MSMPMSQADLPPEMMAELQRLRKLAQPATTMTFDGAYVLVAVTTTPTGLALITPVVIKIPVGDWMIMAGQLIGVLGVDFWRQVQGSLNAAQQMQDEVRKQEAKKQGRIQ